TVIDLASRRVVGWATADHLRTDLVAQALTNAVAARRPTDPVIFHSDRGCQYVSTQYARLADQLGVRLSVGRKGQCWDKGFASQCTSWRGLGGNSFSERASLPGDEAGVAGRGWLVEAFVLVVGLAGVEHSGLVPVLDCGRVHAESLRDLVLGEQSVGA